MFYCFSSVVNFKEKRGRFCMIQTAHFDSCQLLLKSTSFISCRVRFVLRVGTKIISAPSYGQFTCYGEEKKNFGKGNCCLSLQFDGLNHHVTLV